MEPSGWCYKERESKGQSLGFGLDIIGSDLGLGIGLVDYDFFNNIGTS